MAHLEAEATQRRMDEREYGHRIDLEMPKDDYPFFAAIMTEVVPQQFIIPKLPPVFREFKSGESSEGVQCPDADIWGK